MHGYSHSPGLSNSLKSLRYCLAHDLGGDRQNSSPLTNAQISDIEFFPQLSGFVLRHPRVCFSESSGFKGAWQLTLLMQSPLILNHFRSATELDAGQVLLGLAADSESK